jgi:hypothetical protein
MSLDLTIQEYTDNNGSISTHSPFTARFVVSTAFDAAYGAVDDATAPCAGTSTGAAFALVI